MRQIAISELQRSGYTEDLAARRRFLRPYGWFLWSVLMVCGITVYLLAGRLPETAAYSNLSDLAVVILVAGFGGLIVSGIHARDAVPRSRHDGQPMERYVRSDSAADCEEYIYIDHTNRTYFRRVVGVGTVG